MHPQSLLNAIIDVSREISAREIRVVAVSIAIDLSGRCVSLLFYFYVTGIRGFIVFLRCWPGSHPKPDSRRRA